jgi:hypothetical protein
MNETDIAWAAGLFEGEGTILLATKTRTAHLCVAMTDHDVLERLTELLGGRLRGPYTRKGNPHWKPQWRWNLHGIEQVQEVLRMFYPYLGARRRARAAEAIASYYEFKRVPQRRGYRKLDTYRPRQDAMLGNDEGDSS